MSPKEIGELWESDDLVLLGMKADEVRSRLHPGGIITYSDVIDSELLGNSLELVIQRGTSSEQVAGLLEQARSAMPDNILPIFKSDVAGAEYLKLVAVCRIYLKDVPNVQVAPVTVGLKVAQLALRFGANDFRMAGTDGEEEDFRRIIREAGFVPKTRNTNYSAFGLH